MKELYLDNSATTPICEEALARYIEVSRGAWGNPSSRHGRGKEAEDVLTDARRAVREALGARDGQVVFTSGGTEANNLAITGRLLAKPRYKRMGKLLTTEGEHASVSAPLEALRAEGVRVVEIPTRGGEIDLARLAEEMTPDVVLVSMMLVNNESGALYDIAAVSRLMRAKSPDAVLHVDATQGFLKVPFTVSALGAHMVTVSAHKVHGPKGVGALWIDAATVKNGGVAATLLGGGQEGGLRSGTENVPGIAAFAAAIRARRADREQAAAHMTALRDRLVEGIRGTSRLAEVQVNLSPRMAPHIVSITLPRIKSETMLHFLSAKGIYVSSGSACSSHNSHLSSAMLAWGLTEAEADCTVRVSFCAENTAEDVDALLAALAEGVQTLVRMRR